jgi:glycosyltransferase involved in cell wall biosynthesis
VRALMLTPDEGRLDRRIAQEAAALAEAGWQVDILPAVDPKLVFEDDLAPGVRLIPAVRATRRDGRLKPLLRTAKRLVSRIVPVAGRAIEATQYRARDIAREIIDDNLPGLDAVAPYDLVFAHDIPVLPLADVLSTKWQCPMVCDLHEIFPDLTAWITSDRGRHYWRAIEATYLPRADAVLAVNDGVIAYVDANYRVTAPRVVINNSVPYVAREALTGRGLRAIYPIPEPARVMLWAGTLRAQTNLDIVLEGFAQANLDGWVLAILGDGPWQPRLEQVIRANALEDRVFIGKRARQQDLIRLCASADIGLLPYLPESLNLLNATPNKLFEYIQARLPIAATKLPMVARIIDAHSNGDYVDFRTPASTASGLEGFVSHSLDRITAQVLDDAAREVSWESDAEQLRRVVEAIMTPAPHVRDHDVRETTGSS